MRISQHVRLREKFIRLMSSSITTMDTDTAAIHHKPFPSSVCVQRPYYRITVALDSFSHRLLTTFSSTPKRQKHIFYAGSRRKAANPFFNDPLLGQIDFDSSFTDATARCLPRHRQIERPDNLQLSASLHCGARPGQSTSVTPLHISFQQASSVVAFFNQNHPFSSHSTAASSLRPVHQFAPQPTLTISLTNVSSTAAKFSNGPKIT